MEWTPQNTAFIEKIEVCGFDKFGEQPESFTLSPKVNVLTGANELKKMSLLRAISFMFDRRYEEQALALLFWNESISPEIRSFVRLTIKTVEPVCLGGKYRDRFTVTRYLTEGDVDYIFYQGVPKNHAHHKVKIDIFHMQFPFVLVKEPRINEKTLSNAYDLWRMWSNTLALNSTKEICEIETTIEFYHANFCAHLTKTAEEYHAKEVAILSEWCTLELVSLEKKTVEMEKQLRDIEAQLPPKTRDEMRRECTIDYKRMINQLQATEMLANHRQRCLHFNQTQSVIQALLEKSRNEMDSAKKEENSMNANITKCFNDFLREMETRVEICRTSQLIGPKRQNYIRKFTKLSDLGIDAAVIRPGSQRNAVVARLEKDLNAFDEVAKKGLKGLHKFQEEYNHCQMKLNEIKEEYRNDRRQFIENLERKYTAMIENLPNEVKLLELIGTMLKGKIRITHSLSDYFEFWNQTSIDGLKFALNVLTDPATDPKFANDFVGNVMDFIQMDKIDETFIKFVVPVILDILPSYVFQTQNIGKEFIELVKTDAADRKWWHCRIICNDNYNDHDQNNRTPPGYKSLSEIMFTDEVRRQYRSMDFIFGKYLVFKGIRVPANAQAKAIEWKKTLIFPSANYFYNEDGFRIWIHNGTGDSFKDLLNLWHTKIRPEQQQLLEYGRQANKLHSGIEKLKKDAKVDGYCGDVSKLRALSRAQSDHFIECRQIIDDLLTNTGKYVNWCRILVKDFGQHDARRLKLMVLQDGPMTDQGVRDSATRLAEIIGNEKEELAGGYGNDIQLFDLRVNVLPLEEQKKTYMTYIYVPLENSRATPLPEEEIGIEGVLVDADAVVANLEMFEDLWKRDYELLANKKRIAELKHANHNHLINVDWMEELRQETDAELDQRRNDFHEKMKIMKMVLPAVGIAYAEKSRKLSNRFTSHQLSFKNSMTLYEARAKFPSSMKRATLRHHIAAMIEILEKINDRLSVGQSKSIAVRMQTDAKQWIIHCDSNEIQMDFDDLVDPTMRMNFIYIDRVTNEVVVSRMLDVNEHTVTMVLYLELGMKLNNNLLVLNASIGLSDYDELKTLISKYGRRNGTDGDCRQILFVPPPHIKDLRGLFPNDEFKTISFN